MQRIKLLGLCFSAVLLLCTVAVAGASALPEHIYQVEGKKLEANEKKEIAAKAKTEFTIKGEVPIGAKWVVKCKKVKLNPAEKPAIVGGIPGTSEKERFEFEECTATVGGVKCEKVTVEAAQANDELVTIIKPAGKAGKIANWFVPTIGKVFFKIKFTKCGILGNLAVEVEGTTAALVVPEKVLGVMQTWVWNEAEEITEIERQSKELVKVGLKSGGLPVTLNGEVEVELLAKEKWGAF
jgi:hypothetical protein